MIYPRRGYRRKKNVTLSPFLMRKVFQGTKVVQFMNSGRIYCSIEGLEGGLHCNDAQRWTVVLDEGAFCAIIRIIN